MKMDRKIYIGNLPPDVRSKDLDSVFSKYGRISDIDLKRRRGPPFAFIEFEDERDAEDAVRDCDGYKLNGYALRVEFPRASNNSFRRGGAAPGFSRGSGPSRRSDYRVLVTNLPPSGSWQDLKDHMREAGDVGFADVFKDGSGVVEFLRYEDMKVKRLIFVFARNVNILAQSQGRGHIHRLETETDVIPTVVLVPGLQVVVDKSSSGVLVTNVIIPFSFGLYV
ncbi:unnamed protein product [Hymenolepis diminuta]|uniref:RRM domain-containing protein n=1 Tax=Hymenolepis diminuta TaxID=6216 RepID=A0A564XXD9_HYMDI|nr:unnamed protein product [Hymenolepis diminuta]